MSTDPNHTEYFLCSERLGFRQWRAEDLPLARALWGDSSVMRYIGGPLEPLAAQARMQSEILRQQKLGLQYWPIFLLATGEHVGCAGLRLPIFEKTPKPDVLEIGVHIRQPFWSGRYGEEAARTVIGLAFREHGVHALVAAHHPENHASQALITRLGFQYTHDWLWSVTGLLHPWYRLEQSNTGRSSALVSPAL